MYMMEPASTKWSFRWPLHARAPATKMRFATDFSSPPKSQHDGVWKHLKVYAEKALVPVLHDYMTKCFVSIRTNSELQCNVL